MVTDQRHQRVYRVEEALRKLHQKPPARETRRNPIKAEPGPRQEVIYRTPNAADKKIKVDPAFVPLPINTCLLKTVHLLSKPDTQRLKRKHWAQTPFVEAIELVL
jgi:hypothetical protein